MMPGGGYCFAPTHSLQDNSPTENVRGDVRNRAQVRPVRLSRCLRGIGSGLIQRPYGQSRTVPSLRPFQRYPLSGSVRPAGRVQIRSPFRGQRQHFLSSPFEPSAHGACPGTRGPCLPGCRCVRSPVGYRSPGVGVCPFFIWRRVPCLSPVLPIPSRSGAGLGHDGTGSLSGEFPPAATA